MMLGLPPQPPSFLKRRIYECVCQSIIAAGKSHVRRDREVGAARLFVPLARALLVTLSLNRKHSVVLLFREDG